jgi:hypothetical protein
VKDNKNVNKLLFLKYLVLISSDEQVVQLPAIRRLFGTGTPSLAHALHGATLIALG